MNDQHLLERLILGPHENSLFSLFSKGGNGGFLPSLPLQSWSRA